MKVKTTVTLGLRVVVLTLILFAFYSINFLGLRLSEGVQISPAMGLLICFLQAVVLSYVIVRSRWAGWPLIVAIFFVFSCPSVCSSFNHLQERHSGSITVTFRCPAGFFLSK